MSKKKINILQVNNIDQIGKVFNGYNSTIHLNKTKEFKSNQIVNIQIDEKDKISEKLYGNIIYYLLEQKVFELQKNYLKVYSQLSLSDNFLLNNKKYKNADIINFHQHHNGNYSLNIINEISKEKKVVLSLHDLWFLTGNSIIVNNDENLKDSNNPVVAMDTLFKMNRIYVNQLWEIKKSIMNNPNVYFMVSSNYMLDKIKERNIIDENRICFVPFGVDLEKFKDNKTKNKLRKNKNIDPSDIVLFFRAQKEFKGTNYIVDALKDYNTNQNITLLTCGETGLLNSLKNKFNIVELGFVSEDEIIDGYLMSDMFLMPSIGESFGFMAVEAMACSRPVIVFDNTSLPSVTNAPEVGYLVKNKSSIDLQKAIDHLIKNPKELNERSKLSRKYAEKHYDINKYYETLEKAYKEINLKKLVVKNTKEEVTTINVRLLKKLKKITKQLNLMKDDNLNDFFKNIENNYKLLNEAIDYSKIENQYLLSKYNKKMYEVIVNKEDIETLLYNDQFHYIVFRKMQTLLRLLRDDRKEILKVLKEKTNKK